MATFETKKNESFSNACLNIMFQPQPAYTDMRRVVTSSLANNTCLMSVSSSYSCTQYCTSFPGMECKNAYYPTTVIISIII